MAKQRKERARKTSGGRKDPFWRRSIKALPVIAIGILLTFIFSNAGLLRKLETTALDTTMRLRRSRTDSEVAIVRITDDDYKALFGRKSPLDPNQLKNILEAIAIGKPKLIAVDIDTSSPEFKEMPLPAAPTIVWARNGVYSKIKREFYVFDVLGARQPTPPAGVVLLKQDDDGAIRRYTRLCKTSQGLMPSFPWAVIKQIQNEKTRALTESEDELMADYAGSIRVNLTAQDVLDLAKTEGYQENGILKDQIVLLGGDYAVQDEHDTPVGWMLGVEALARMIETELEGGGLRPANTFTILLLEVLDGFVLLVLFRVLSLGKALLTALVALPVLSLSCSLAAFWSLAHWAYFVPILTLVFFHQAYQHGKDYFKKLPEQIATDLTGEK